MREFIDLRVGEERMLRALPPDFGEDLDDAYMAQVWRDLDPKYPGGVRRILLPRESPEWPRLIRMLKRAAGLRWWLGMADYHAWVVRRYTPEELREAEVLALQFRQDFEPTGEQCGTQYDESTACRRCGAGRTQRSDLCLCGKALPSDEKSRGGARPRLKRSIAGEMVISRGLAELLESIGTTGYETRPVRRGGPEGEVVEGWRQLLVTGRAGRMVPPTQFGLTPFELDPLGRYRCRAHVPGLNLLSEVHVPRTDWDGSDLTATENLVGWRQGALRPNPMVLISQRLYRLLLEHRVRGVRVEAAHLV